jgi:hypothetical protein
MGMLYGVSLAAPSARKRVPMDGSSLLGARAHDKGRWSATTSNVLPVSRVSVVTDLSS